MNRSASLSLSVLIHKMRIVTLTALTSRECWKVVIYISSTQNGAHRVGSVNTCLKRSLGRVHGAAAGRAPGTGHPAYKSPFQHHHRPTGTKSGWYNEASSKRRRNRGLFTKRSVYYCEINQRALDVLKIRRPVQGLGHGGAPGLGLGGFLVGGREGGREGCCGREEEGLRAWHSLAARR